MDDLPIHEFIDSTKSASADLRHRAVLHNADLGPPLVALAFPERTDAIDIALRHVTEDHGRAPLLSEWLVDLDRRRWPVPPFRRLGVRLDDVAMTWATQIGLADAAPVIEVLNFLRRSEILCGEIAQPILFNAFGAYLVRRVFGPARIVAGVEYPEVVFDPAHAAEALIVARFGRIPSLDNVVTALRPSLIDQHPVAATSEREHE
jgi:hypothetical protein